MMCIACRRVRPRLSEEGDEFNNARPVMRAVSAAAPALAVPVDVVDLTEDSPIKKSASTCALWHADRMALGLVLYRIGGIFSFLAFFLGGMDLLPKCTLIEKQLPVTRVAANISAAPTRSGYCVERLDLGTAYNMFPFDYNVSYACVRTSLPQHIASLG